ncbi:galanin receptor type 2-like [Asterias amurensis]|uniref:galanin receptor type 2-like n=1 Tax=Asterias amurensis TaxID=7602 RepID=UPI003AB50EFE
MSQYDIITNVQGTIGMILNTLAWLVILRTKSLHNTPNYLLAYLAVVDSILCCYLIVFSATKMTQLPESFIGREIYCRIGFIEFLIAYSSIYALCLVTYERYIGIVHPLHYPRMMSPKKVILIIFIASGMSFLFSTPRLFTWTASNDTCIRTDSSDTMESALFVLFLLFGYLLPILFMGWIYYKIQATLKRSAQQLQQQNVQGAALRLFQARQNVISMLKIVMGALFVLWTPQSLYYIFCWTEWGFFNICSGTLDVLSVVVFMHRLNSVINPIIYIFKHKKFRKGLQDMLCCCIGRPPRPDLIGVQIAMNR